MGYVKVTENGYILAVGTGVENGVSITDSEYEEILSAIRRKPPRVGDTDYRLKEDLTWEEYTVPPPEPDPEISAAEAYDIIFGGAE